MTGTYYSSGIVALRSDGNNFWRIWAISALSEYNSRPRSCSAVDLV